jgi:hypothetical protein
MKVSVDQLRTRMAAFERARRHYDWKSEQPGRLHRYEVWSHRYTCRPYLVGAREDRLAERFCDVFMNVVELGDNGKISPVPMAQTDEFIELFTHLRDEYGSRMGGLPGDLVERARAPLAKYFENGTPIGVTMFEGYPRPSGPILVKYGRREFLEPMLRTGELRLANAGLYNQSGMLNSRRDNETERVFYVPTYNERLKGETHTELQGLRIEFNDEDIELPLVFGDYYLLSLCDRIHCRMPTDFDADAAIVIRDPVLFTERLSAAFMARHPGFEVMSGKVIYYDPYRDYSKFDTAEMAKHFRYAYQHEARVVFRPRRKTERLEPVFLNIGPMTEYADLVPA